MTARNCVRHAGHILALCLSTWQWFFVGCFAFDYANFYSRSHDAVIRVNNYAVNVMEKYEYAGEFREWQALILGALPSYHH
jgi:hypothetical protein